LTEFEELIIELTYIDVHDIEFHTSEVFNSSSKLGENAHNTVGHGFSFSVTDFNLLKPIELHDGSSQVHDVLASFTKRI
jgi:hypothetical protein